MTADIRLRKIIRDLRAQAGLEDATGMAKFGIRSDNVLGIPVATLRMMAEGIGTDHALALELWKAGIFEARVLALLIADPAAVTEKQMERWAKDFDNWAICDGVCTPRPLKWRRRSTLWIFLPPDGSPRTPCGNFAATW